MEKSTKILISVGSILLIGGISFVVYKEFFEEAKGEGDVSDKAKDVNKITFVRKK